MLDFLPSPEFVYQLFLQQIPQLIAILHWIAAFIVLAEGLNKLHRTDPLQRGLTLRQRVVVLLKVAAWIGLVMGAGGACISPLVVVPIAGDLSLGHLLLADRVSLVDLFFVGGFALLIVRSRFKEPKHDQQPKP